MLQKRNSRIIDNMLVTLRGQSPLLHTVHTAILYWELFYRQVIIQYFKLCCSHEVILHQN